MMKDKYKVLINSVWIVLISYCIIKVFFGTCFELMTSSKNFLELTLFIDNHILLKRTIACINTLITGYFILCAVLKQKYLTKKQLLVFIPLTIIKSFMQFNFKIFGYILELFILIIYPMIIGKKSELIIFKKIKINGRIFKPIIGYLLLFIFQLLSMFLSEIALLKFTAINTLTALLYSLEIYFCTILYYLYSNKKQEVK